MTRFTSVNEACKSRRRTSAVSKELAQPTGGSLSAPARKSIETFSPAVAISAQGNVYMSAYAAEVVSPWQRCAARYSNRCWTNQLSTTRQLHQQRPPRLCRHRPDNSHHQDGNESPDQHTLPLWRRLHRRLH